MCGYVCLLYVCALCMHLYIKVEHLLLNKLSSSVPCWHLWSCVTLSTLGTSHRKICRRSQAAMACPSQTHFNKWETHTAVITSSQRQKKKPHTHTYQKYTKSKVVTSNKKQIQLTKKNTTMTDGWSIRRLTQKQTHLKVWTINQHANVRVKSESFFKHVAENMLHFSAVTLEDLFKVVLWRKWPEFLFKTSKEFNKIIKRVNKQEWWCYVRRSFTVLERSYWSQHANELAPGLPVS